jgi:polyhydroxyalkanoate synthesis regulator phasin
LNDKADKIEVVQARAYTDEEITNLKQQLEQTHEQIRIEISNFREDYYIFKSKDFANLEARVAALEKRI